MNDFISAYVRQQIGQACGIIRHHVQRSPGSPRVRAIHLYGSAVDGGLKPTSDIDLLVAVSSRLEPDVHQTLARELLTVSSPPLQRIGEYRPLEVTLLVIDDVVPWRYPARRELQFGEWLRGDIDAGIYPGPVFDPDLAILITQARRHGIALFGESANTLFDPVPDKDLYHALSDTLQLWNTEQDWSGEERNVILTLARVWYTAATGGMTSKEAAADWVLQRLPVDYHEIIDKARADYLYEAQSACQFDAEKLRDFIVYIKSVTTSILHEKIFENKQ